MAVSVNSQQRATQKANTTSVYNLKRRIASLPPISSRVFHEQVLPADTPDDETEPAFQKSCIACQQHYSNRKAWHAHLKSRNHIQAFADFNSKATTSEDSPFLENLSLEDPENQSSDDEEEFNAKQCLFCKYGSADMELNLKHMSQAHSFFIPDAEYLIDMESLLSYLFTIISEFNECLFCASLKSSKFAVQAHMKSKGHCKFDLEDEENQFRQFYDLSGDADEEYITQPKTLVPHEDELRLPSGKILGNRTARPQRPPKRPSSPSPKQKVLDESETVEVSAKESKDQRLVMRAGTSTSLVGVPEVQQRALMAMADKMMKAEARAKNEYQLRLERGGNRQKRYKVPSIGKKAGGLEKRLG